MALGGEKKKMKTKIIAVLIAAMVLVGVGGAALLSHYSTIEGVGTVQQSIVVDGNSYTNPITQSYTITNDSFGGNYGGNVFTESFVVTNRADIPGYVTITTNPANDLAVTTKYLASLTLDNKNPADWSRITGDGVKGVLTYELNARDFNFDFTATGLDNIEYALVYYADEPDRYDNWGGANPGAVIGIGTAVNGQMRMDDVFGTNSVDLEMDLPNPLDFNTGDYYDSDWEVADYGKSDNYKMRTGAKVWLVPTNDLTLGTDLPLIAWNPETYLFETDLINYDDTNNAQPDCGQALRIGANSKFTLIIENTFDLATTPGTYAVTTDVSPA